MLTVCQPEIRCPSDYIFDKKTNMCFKLYKEDRVTWEDARRSCQRNGVRTHLATVDTQERKGLIGQYIQPFFQEPSDPSGECMRLKRRAVTHLNG